MPPRQTGSTPQGFNFTEAARRVCERVIAESAYLGHIDLSQVMISFARSRKPGRHGMWASLTPLRFQNGQREGMRGDHRIKCQTVLDANGNEMLYVLNFYLPRYLDLPFEDKITTIFHELWHISPNFDGDVRRFPGRCYAHSQSEKHYDAMMQKMAHEWLAQTQSHQCLDDLTLSFQELRRRHGQIFGTRVAAPKLIPCDR